jgi:GT2 family glycosyltransferase
MAQAEVRRVTDGPEDAGAGASAPTLTAVVPVFNKRDLLRRSLDSIVEAARRCGRVELILVDHYSTDGSWQLLREYLNDATVARLSGGTISAVRNYGARLARGRLLSFLDCDVVVPADYFQRLIKVFETSGAAAVGCECGIPAAPHWSERAWYELHVIRRDGDRHYLNAANFAVRRDAFDYIGGFDEKLHVGEDTDVCARLLAAGHRVHEAQALSVVHLGNPKSVTAFFRKELWHGRAILSGRSTITLSRATVMIFAHLSAVLLGAAAIVWPGRLGSVPRLLCALGLVLATPVVTVAYRYRETGRVYAPMAALTLYTVYYFARATAVLSSLKRKASRAFAALQ